MKARTITMLIFFAVVSVTAVILLVIGVSTHSEPGLMGACWNGDAVSQYEVDGARVCPELRWDPSLFPLRVISTAYSGDPSDEREAGLAVTRALTTVNNRLNFNVLTLTNGNESDIHVTVGTPVGGDGLIAAGEDTLHRRNATGVSECVIREGNTGTIEMQHMALVHGLGHCLGLAHDPFDLSIMRAVQRPVPDGDIPPWFTDHDRSILRNLYGPPRTAD